MGPDAERRAARRAARLAAPRRDRPAARRLGGHRAGDRVRAVPGRRAPRRPARPDVPHDARAGARAAVHPLVRHRRAPEGAARRVRGRVPDLHQHLRRHPRRRRAGSSRPGASSASGAGASSATSCCPGALPSWLVGLRFSLGIAWIVLVAAEQINATSGIGALMTNAQNLLQTDVILVGLLVYSALGLASDRLVRTLERRTLSWRHGPAVALSTTAAVLDGYGRRFGDRTVIDARRPRACARARSSRCSARAAPARARCCARWRGSTPRREGVVEAPPERAVVFQDHRLLPWRRVWRNVIIGLRGRTRDDADPRARRGRHRGPRRRVAARRCRAASRSASRWPARSSASRGCCCSTSRSARSTR